MGGRHANQDNRQADGHAGKKPPQPAAPQKTGSKPSGARAEDSAKKPT